MTVDELRKALQDVPGDLEVVILGDSGEPAPKDAVFARVAAPEDVTDQAIIYADQDRIFAIGSYDPTPAPRRKST